MLINSQQTNEAIIDKVYWIKTNLHKDGTPTWNKVIGEPALKNKMDILRELGYNPRIDHTVIE